MAQALEIISPNEIYSDIIYRDPVPPHIVYMELIKLVKRNASNERIAANRAFDFFSVYFMNDSAAEKQNGILYDLTLLEEPGMNLNRDEMLSLINKLK